MNKYVRYEDVGRIALQSMSIANGEWAYAMRWLPTIDICFCRECKYWDDTCGWCNAFDSSRNCDDFCSIGERNTDSNTSNTLDALDSSEKPNNLSEKPTSPIRRAPITALEVALSECKARHNGCENCNTECAWRE